MKRITNSVLLLSSGFRNFVLNLVYALFQHGSQVKMSEESIKQYNSDTLPEVSEEDLKQLKAVKDENIDFSDIPEVDEMFWKNAKLKTPKRKPKFPFVLITGYLNGLRKRPGRAIRAV